MTERAAGNGHSWLWASHIRTKQTKWLEQNLQDMEDKVEHVLNLIQKDGDSFARRAEMYYKHRPEVISFMEETVRAYRSLAVRYDKLSTELQKANTTIASICPEKVTYEDDDDYTVSPSKLPKKPSQKATKTPKGTKIPKPPKPPTKGVLKNYISKEKLSQEAKLKQQQFDEAKSKLESLKHKFNLHQANNEEQNDDVELGEMIDKLVNKMITLETSVTSQTALSDTLTKQNDDLHKQLQTLEAEKIALMTQKVGKKDELRWLQMLLNGLEDKDDILLEDYITILKSYRDIKRKLSEEEKRNQGTLSSMKSAIVKRDDTIRLMVQKLKHLQETLGEDKVDIPSIHFLDEPQAVPVSPSEEKLRTDLDTILNQNLDLWLNFSNTFRQVYKFKTQVKNLLEEVKKVKSKGVEGKSGTSMSTTDVLQDIKPIYKHLKEINGKLTAWLHNSTSLKDELDTISLCLSKIHEEITHNDEVKFSAHEAAKFKGEIWNMKQENNKVNEELEAGLHHAIVLKHEIEQTLERLEMEFGFSANQNQPRKGRSSKRSVTLRSLIFGGKSKKPKFSFFSCLGHHKRTRSV